LGDNVERIRQIDAKNHLSEAFPRGTTPQQRREREDDSSKESRAIRAHFEQDLALAVTVLGPAHRTLRLAGCRTPASRARPFPRPKGRFAK
jgi:hypothetical protein